MLQKHLITLFTIIAVLFLALFSPYSSFAADAVANNKCNNIKLLNKEWQKWCGSQGWGTDANGRWMQMK